MNTPNQMPWVFSSRCLANISARLRTTRKCRVLDFGAASQGSLTFLAESGCKLEFADLHHLYEQHNPHTPESVIAYLSKRKQKQYDVIFCWDLFNYFSDTELNTVLSYLQQISSQSALLYFLILDRQEIPAKPSELQIVNAEQLSMFSTEEKMPRLLRHGMRTMSETLREFSRESTQLFRNGYQEHLWVKNPLKMGRALPDDNTSATPQSPASFS